MLRNLTIKQTADLLKESKISSVELTNYYLDRIRRYDPDIRAFITVDDSLARKRAKESDKRRRLQKQLSDWDGMPIAVKDVLVTKDFPTTAGSKMLEEFNSPYDATIVKKIRQSGMVIIGKTNLDEFAMGSSTENSAYFPTRNPWDISRVPGGSSGGSAAAVSGDLVSVALGSDTGGSIRQPASLCGIVGFKPTYGNVSRYGLIAMASSLDQVGPMTKDVEDARIMFDIIAGSDDNDPTSRNSQTKNLPEKIRSKFANGNLQGLKVGVPKEYFVDGMDKNVSRSINRSIQLLQKIRAEVISISLPHTQYALSVYYVLMPVEVASNLARYDGMKFGSPSIKIKAKDLKLKSYIDEIKYIRAEGFGAEVKRRIILGTFASSAGYADQYYIQAQKVRSLIKFDFDQAFQTVDIIATPVSPTTAFKIGEKTDDPLSMYLSDIFTIPVNLAGLPAISIPTYPADGLPVGFQLIAPQFHDQLLFKVGQAFESASNYQFRSPLYGQ